MDRGEVKHDSILTSQHSIGCFDKGILNTIKNRNQRAIMVATRVSCFRLVNP